MHVDRSAWDGVIGEKWNSKKNMPYKGSIYDAGSTFESFRVPHGFPDMGFGTGMTGACLGKPSNKGIFAVKFMPTFSGLQEAQRLHNHFSSKKCGKQEFRSNGKRNQDDGYIQSEDSDATLYGYMALAEDLDKLSEDTKKRCLVKSRKDIQAIADAPLNTAD